MRSTICVLLACFGIGFAQQTPEKLTFEVASVKPTPGHPTYIRVDPKPERFVAEHAPLKVLIEFAYNLQGWQIDGGPKWADSQPENPKWDIEAKPATRASTAEMRTMLQALLADRFSLRMHKETRPGNGYSLVVAGQNQKSKESQKLKESKTGSCPTPAGTCGGVYNFGGAIAPREVGQRATMAQLAEELSRVLGTAVQDNTALQGFYDFELRWKPEPGQPGVADGRLPYSGDANAPTLLEAVEDQLGLKLQRTKVPLDILVIDAAEPASSN